MYICIFFFWYLSLLKKIEIYFAFYHLNHRAITKTTMNANTTKSNDNCKTIKDEKIEFSNYWNDENHLIASYSNTMMRFWSKNYTVSLVNNVNNNIVIQYPLPETRICFGIMTCPDKNIFIYVHCNYNNNKPSIIIEIYHINDKVNKLREFIIPSNHSCGITSGVLQRAGPHMFNVIWGDLVNCDELSFVLFGLHTYMPTKIININDIEDFEDIKQYYFITDTCILKSDIIAHNNNKLNIAIVNMKQDNNCICFIEDIVLPYNHKFDKHQEIESSIIESLIDFGLLCLVRVKLEDKIDILHIETYIVDILINMEKNSVISISPKIKYDKYDDNVNSSIYFKECNPYIWTDKQ